MQNARLDEAQAGIKTTRRNINKFGYADDTTLKAEKLWKSNKFFRVEKRWQEYTEELYRKDLNDPDNHDGVITHLKSDILESKVKWVLGNIIMNKASGGDRIPADLFKS